MVNSDSINKKINKELAVLFFEMLVNNSACFLRVDKIYDSKYSDILSDIDNAIEYFSLPDVEQYEKCYYLKKVREQL